MRVIKTILLFAVAALALLPLSEAAEAKGKEVRVMTRNLYLGADLSPGLQSGSLAELSNGAGIIYRSVGSTKPRDRMRQLAREIRSQNPDLVGLQEVALWREITPPNVYLPGGEPPISTKVRFDFLSLLLQNLNSKRAKAQRYRVVATQNQFDFETPADADDNDATCAEGPWTGALGEANGCGTFPGADLTGRLTMRDVILAKRGVKVSRSLSESFASENLYQETIAGAVPVQVTRGWTAVEARVRGSRPFRFVNAHLEAFGDPEGAKCLQAGELYDAAIASSSLPVLLVGDMNSDDDTVDGDPLTPELDGSGHDRCAYLSLLADGMRSLTAGANSSCCLQADLLDSLQQSDFDHQVDHIFANSSRITRLGPTRMTGTRPFRTLAPPYWGSDHRGVAQRVRVR